jgi:hypothetical protein
MRVRIYESRDDNASICIHEFRVTNILLDLVAGTDFLDLPVADKQSTIANNPELQQLCPNTRALRSSHRRQLRRVQKGK